MDGCTNVIFNKAKELRRRINSNSLLALKLSYKKSTTKQFVSLENGINLISFPDLFSVEHTFHSIVPNVHG